MIRRFKGDDMKRTKHGQNGNGLMATVGASLIATGFLAAAIQARAEDTVYLSIVMPVTGFMSVEGGSQRNGALMAAEKAPPGLKVESPVFDTGTSATGAASALDKALSSKSAIGPSTTVFGTEMVAMLPVSLEYKVPLLTISGLSRLTESGPYIFRSFPTTARSKLPMRAMSSRS
jgi:branched-chain amino acid transport system substrate-binding protein